MRRFPCSVYRFTASLPRPPMITNPIFESGRYDDTMGDYYVR